jgi:predicted patatin/cPLA2 family phospholipase
MDIDTLCFCSGGIQGIVLIGVLKQLLNNNFIDIKNIRTFSGSSIGAMLAFLMCINFTIDEIILFIISYDFNNIESEYNIENIFTSFGFNKGEIIETLFCKLLKHKLNKSDYTFMELYKITNKKLIIVGTNFTKGTEQIFSYKKTPTYSVIKALRISISIPIIFTPIKMNNDYFVDGALLNNFPINACNKKTTLGLNLINPFENKLNSIQDVILGTLKILTTHKIYKSKYIINIKIYDTNFTNFNVTPSYLLKLINHGEKIGQKYLIRYHKYKIKKIQNEIENKKRNIISNILDTIILKLEDNHL